MLATPVTAAISSNPIVPLISQADAQTGAQTGAQADAQAGTQAGAAVDTFCLLLYDLKIRPIDLQQHLHSSF